MDYCKVQALRNKWQMFKLIICILLLLFPAASYAKDLKVVVIVKAGNRTPYNQAADAFENRLQKKAKISQYILDETGGKKELIRKIDNDNPDLIFTAGTFATRVLLPEFCEIPIVFSMILNPVRLKFAADWSGSGNNLAGTALDIPLEEQFKWIKRIMPNIRQVGVIWQMEYSRDIIKTAASIAQKEGIELIARRIDGIEGIIPALETLCQKVDLLWAIPDPGVYNRKTIRQILLFTLRHKFPFMGASEQYVKAGAFFCLSANYKEQGNEAAAIAIRILNGADPSKIPVRLPHDIGLGINMNTSKLLGINIPPKLLKDAVKY